MKLPETFCSAEAGTVKSKRSPSLFVLQLGDGGKRVLYALGTVLFALSLAYVASFTARNSYALSDVSRFGARPLIGAAALYAVAHLSGSAAWILGLRQMGQDIPFLTGVRINFITQIGKYLPGNVAHYVGRAGLASASGVKLSKSGTSTLLEILATVAAAMGVAAVAMLCDHAPAKALDQALAGNIAFPVAVGSAGVVTAIVLLIFARVPARAFLVTSAFAAITCILVGLSFFMLVSAVSATALSPMAATGIFAIAWTAGYVVPGAPAGLGVREAILVSWVGPIIGSGPAVTCVILHRVLSACMDAIVALLGYSWLRLEKAAHFRSTERRLSIGRSVD